ncbi:hypothetical protein [Sinorhizobium meliloti]|nr:hypothetical protein [Sinorhizobium meliloti]
MADKEKMKQLIWGCQQDIAAGGHHPCGLPHTQGAAAFRPQSA